MLHRLHENFALHRLHIKHHLVHYIYIYIHMYTLVLLFICLIVVLQLLEQKVHMLASVLHISGST